MLRPPMCITSGRYYRDTCQRDSIRRLYNNTQTRAVARRFSAHETDSEQNKKIIDHSKTNFISVRARARSLGRVWYYDISVIAM
jgi:hypothetical protein